MLHQLEVHLSLEDYALRLPAIVGDDLLLIKDAVAELKEKESSKT